MDRVSSDSHRISAGEQVNGFQNRNRSKYSRARVRRTLYPQSECHSVGGATRSSFFLCLVWRLERERMAAFGADSKLSKLAVVHSKAVTRHMSPQLGAVFLFSSSEEVI